MFSNQGCRVIFGGALSVLVSLSPLASEVGQPGTHPLEYSTGSAVDIHTHTAQ